MGQAVHRYLIFETAGGFCGIAWNDTGITRFQLPTKSVEATKRILLRHVPGAKPAAPTPEVAEAVAAAKRYFEGEQADFSGFRLDLGEQDPLFERIYAAARRIGWGRTIATVPFPVLEAPRRDMCPSGLATADAPYAKIIAEAEIILFGLVLALARRSEASESPVAPANGRSPIWEHRAFTH